MKFKLMLLALLLGAPLMAAAEETISLSEAVSQALAYAPHMQAATAERDAAAEDISIARAWILPRIAAHGSLAQKNQDLSFDRPNTFMSPTIRNREQAYGITLSQPLLNIESWAAYEQGSIASATGELKLAMTRQQTMLQIAAAWLDVMRAKASFLSAQAGEKAMQRLAAQAGASFDVGTLSINESLAANSRRDLAKSGRIYASQMLMNAESQLSSLLGRTITAPVIMEQNLRPLQTKPENLEWWLERAQASSFEVQLSEQNLNLAEISHLQAQGSAAPKLNLVAGWEHNRSSDGSFGGSTVNASSIGIELSVPLYAGGATWAALRKSTHQKLGAEYGLQEAKRQARLNTQSAWLSLQSTAAEIEALEAAVNSAIAEKKAAQSGYEVGLRNIVEALDAEERLASAKQRYADALARHALAYLQLTAAVGNLNMQTVTTISDWVK